jgi:hypothetical protein
MKKKLFLTLTFVSAFTVPLLASCSGLFGGSKSSSKAGASITTLDQLLKISKSGSYQLGADIDCASANLTSSIFPTENDGYTGTFDGDGHSLKNFTANCPFFGILSKDGCIKNLVVDNFKVLGPYSATLISEGDQAVIKNITTNANCTVGDGSEGNVGGIAGYASRCLFQACVNKATVKGNYNVGGIVGHMDSTNMADCDNQGKVDSLDVNVGGMAGYDFSAGYNRSTTVENCTNEGTITGFATSERAGGILGKAFVDDHSGWNYDSAFITIKNSKNTGTVSGGNNVGGIVGYTEGKSGSTITVTYCENSGSVTGKSCTGGNIGIGNDKVVANNLTNSGAITGETKVGGIVGGGYDVSFSKNHGAISLAKMSPLPKEACLGGVSGSARHLLNNFNDGLVKDPNTYADKDEEGAYVGGIVGGDWNGNIKSNENAGQVIGNAYVGGIAGADYAYDNNTQVSSNNSHGNIQGNTYVGGVLGMLGGHNSKEINVLTNTVAISQVKMNAALGYGEHYLGGVLGRPGDGSDHATVRANTITMSVENYGSLNDTPAERFLVNDPSLGERFNTKGENSGTMTFVS